MSNKLGSNSFEQAYAISPSTPSGTDAVVGTIWVDRDDGKVYRCTSVGPVVFTEITGGPPASADYLVGTANADLSAEIVVGTAPGGELGGTWALPTVDSTHSGSAHHVATTVTGGTHTLSGQEITGVAASLTQSGHAELATAAEINTGTDTTRAVPVDQYVASNRNVRFFLYRCLAPATAHTVTTTVGGDLELPFTGTITEIGAYADTAGVTGLGTIDVNLNGATIMTTNKITLDSSEKTSRTAATAPALTTTAVTVGDIITVDIDGIQTTAALGLTIRLGIRQT